jgi:hypothetical protein
MPRLLALAPGIDRQEANNVRRISAQSAGQKDSPAPRNFSFHFGGSLL